MDQVYSVNRVISVQTVITIPGDKAVSAGTGKRIARCAAGALVLR